mmetsp:Transcript_47935/g.70993  ORF Transcript_47935/g.70993 Transcript_47935/m.70993 type:complete len:216 (+) Transcript_47935:1153-1800(+)
MEVEMCSFFVGVCSAHSAAGVELQQMTIISDAKVVELTVRVVVGMRCAVEAVHGALVSIDGSRFPVGSGVFVVHLKSHVAPFQDQRDSKIVVNRGLELSHALPAARNLVLQVVAHCFIEKRSDLEVVEVAERNVVFVVVCPNRLRYDRAVIECWVGSKAGGRVARCGVCTTRALCSGWSCATTALVQSTGEVPIECGLIGMRLARKKSDRSRGCK